MRVTQKGQITIPAAIRTELGLEEGSEVELVKAPDGGYRLVKAQPEPQRSSRFRAARGKATVKMSTDEILALTRGG